MLWRREREHSDYFARNALRNDKTDSKVRIQIQYLQYENIPSCSQSFFFKSGSLQTIYHEYEIFENLVNH